MTKKNDSTPDDWTPTTLLAALDDALDFMGRTLEPEHAEALRLVVAQIDRVVFEGDDPGELVNRLRGHRQTSTTLPHRRRLWAAAVGDALRLGHRNYLGLVHAPSYPADGDAWQIERWPFELAAKDLIDRLTEIDPCAAALSVEDVTNLLQRHVERLPRKCVTAAKIRAELAARATLKDAWEPTVHNPAALAAKLAGICGALGCSGLRDERDDFAAFFAKPE